MKKLFPYLLLILSQCGQYHDETSFPLIAIQIEDRNGLTETVSTPERLELYDKLDYLSSQPYKKVVRIFKKDGKSQSKISTYHPNGVICQYLEAEEMRAHGAYKEWHPNGQIKIEAQIIGGPADLSPAAQREWLFDQTNQVWDEKGQQIAKIIYEKGVLEGTSLYFHPSGAIKKTVSFKRGILEGEVIEYYETGAIQSKSFFDRGSKEGVSLGYFTNGSIAWEESYNAALLLKGLYYNFQGDLIAKVEDGRGEQASFTNNALSFLIEIKRGVPEGMIKKITPQGELQGTHFIKNGKKQGEEIEYFLSSESNEGGGKPHPKLSLHWDQDSIHGIVKTWYSNGTLQSEREFCHNQKQNDALAWYKNGSLMLVEAYENGQIIKGSYYKKGQNEPVSTVTNGNGTAYIYDENGIFLRKITYAKGKPIDPED